MLWLRKFVMKHFSKFVKLINAIFVNVAHRWIRILDFRPSQCQMIDLWDLVDNGVAKAAGKQPVCPMLFRGNAYPFKRSFVNNRYVVLQLDYSYCVELKPNNSLNYQSWVTIVIEYNKYLAEELQRIFFPKERQLCMILIYIYIYFF